MRQRIRELAGERRRFGYGRLHFLLKKEGVAMNQRRFRRLYRAEGLQVRKRNGRKRALGMRAPLALPSRPNERWSLDFVSDIMKRFVEGADRDQPTLFPECLEDWVDENNPVRVIDVVVDNLDLGDLDFAGVDPQATGRPSYHPAVLLKLYVYGYLNAVQSSRRLEREANRNVEVMWLTRRLAPDHKTIADFRKDNGASIRKVCARFVELCRRLGLLSVASVAIDGSKFKAVNNRDRNFTEGKMARRMAQIEESVARYLHQMDSADRQERSKARAMRINRLNEKIVMLNEEMKRLEAIDKQRLAKPDQQISFTDPDARSMATSGRGSGVVGYNVQAAVDTKHHLIVAHEVTTCGSDRAQLAPMSKLTKKVLGVHQLEVVADRGYFTSEQILECTEAGITVTVSKPQTSNNRARGQFGKPDFRYVANEDMYICPAGEALLFVSYKRETDGLSLRRYATRACTSCKLRKRCTTSSHRSIARWEHEHVLEDVQRSLDENPQAMRIRRETVEHPFGTIKARMGATHFLMKRLKNVKTEMALAVLAYNLTRVMNIIGIGPLMNAIRA
ncbi:MAG: IS1182 family transposase [Hyphomicrobium sp.]